MTEPNVQTPGELSPGEREAVERSTLAASIDNIVSDARKNWEAESAADLAAYSAPKAGSTVGDPAPEVSRAVEMQNATGETVHRLMSPTLALYRTIKPEYGSEFRSPDSDHYTAEWFRGHFLKDPARRMRAYAGLESVYGRTIMLEGDAVADGAVSDGSAGQLIPRPVEQLIQINRDRVAKARRFFSTMTMTKQTHQVPTGAAMNAFMTAEGATATDGSPLITQVELTAQKAQVVATFSVELMDDSAFNLVNFLAERGGGALGELEDDQFFKAGDGTPPNVSAFLNNGASHSITTGDLRFTDILEMYYDVDQVYRSRAIWLAEQSVLLQLSILRHTTSGQQFYLGLTDMPGPITDDPTAEGTLMRRPVYEVPLTAGTIWFGDAKAAYMIGTRQGLQSKMSEHVLFDEDKVMWKMTQRMDGINVDTGAGQQAVGVDLALPT